MALRSVGFVVASVFSMLVGYGLYAAKTTVEEEQASWLAISEDELPLTTALKDLDRALGYGGLIHSFKNYVLRGEAVYRQTATKRLAEARTALVRIRELDLEDGHVEAALGDIGATLDLYETNLQLAFDYYSETASGAAASGRLDGLVRIDDSSALRALTILNMIADEGLAQKRALSMERVADTQNALVAASVFGLLIVIGSFALAVLITRERSSRTRIQQALAQANHLLDEHPDGILLVDDRGVIRRCNERIEAMFGYTQSELIGRNVDMLVPIAFRPNHASLRDGYTREANAREMAGRSTIYGVAKSGTEIPLQINLNRIAQGAEYVTLAACKDLSLVMANARKLERALDEAKGAAEARGRFLAVMSHELRTPLNGIIGFSELLRYELEHNELEPEQALSHSKHIVESGKHLLAMVDDILDFSSAEIKGVQIKPEPVLLRQLIQNIASITAFQRQEANVSMSIECADSLPEYVITDPKRLTQILLNLVGNSVKFTQNGAIRIKAWAQPVTGRAMKLHISVEDNGIGIPADRLEAIFRPFEQVEGSMSRNYGGAGLGLAITKGIVSAMNGDIHVTSDLGQGTRFGLFIEIEDASDVYRSMLTKFRPSEPVDRKKMSASILVVDDMKINAITIQAILEPLGATVTWAESGEQALELASDNQYDMILMDLHMPNLSGVQTAIRLRQNRGAETCPPIYAWTADVLHDFDNQEEKDLWDGVVTKPTPPDEIVGLIASKITLH